MSKWACILFIVALSTGLFTRSLFAQTTNETQTDSSPHLYEAQPVETDLNSTLQSGKNDEPQVQYAPALDGSGLIAMDGMWKTHMLLGATASGGWDSNPDNLEDGTSSAVYTLSPYFGIKATTSKSQYLFQYQPTITGYNSNSYANQTMHVASAKIVVNVNERWNWDLSATGRHGQDSVRLLAPQQTIVVGEVPGTGPGSASYLPNTGTVTYIDGAIGAHYRKSERDSFRFGIANSYNRYSSLNESNSVATASFGYGRDLSPKLEMLAYAQNDYYYGSINCLSFGAGIGFKWHLRDQTFLSLNGGPQLNAPACNNQQGFSYNAAFSTRLSRRSQIYLLTARQPATSYLGPGLWQVSSSGGYQRQVASKDTLNFDLGYVSSDTLTAVSSYHGTYFDGAYGHNIGQGLSVSLSYRGYIGSWNGAQSVRHVAMFSLTWTPMTWAPIAGRLFQ